MIFFFHDTQIPFTPADTGKGQGKRHQLGDICQNQRLFQTHQAKDKGDVPKDCSSLLTDLIPRFPFLCIPLVPSFPTLLSTIWFASHICCAELRGSNWNYYRNLQGHVPTISSHETDAPEENCSYFHLKREELLSSNIFSIQKICMISWVKAICVVVF